MHSDSQSAPTSTRESDSQQPEKARIEIFSNKNKSCIHCNGLNKSGLSLSLRKNVENGPPDFRLMKHSRRRDVESPSKVPKDERKNKVLDSDNEDSTELQAGHFDVNAVGTEYYVAAHNVKDCLTENQQLAARNKFLKQFRAKTVKFISVRPEIRMGIKSIYLSYFRSSES